MTKLVDAKYPEETDKAKHEQLISEIKQSLDEEEQVFRAASVKIKDHKVRQTVKKVTIQEKTENGDNDDEDD